MKRIGIFSIVIILIILAQAFVTAGEKAPVLVTPEWLAAHLNDPDLVILNLGQSARDYRRGHIPGARFLWMSSIAASNPELSFELVPVEQLDTLFEGLGVSNDSRIVLYGVNVSPTARAYITLDYLGMGDRTSILDGGIDAWKAAGHPVTLESSSYKRGSFTPRVKNDAIVDVEYMKSHMNTNGVTIVDARAPQFYNGVGGGFPRPGRIPGAHNLYYTTLLDSTNKYLPLDSIKAKFAAAGIHPDQEIITYCHVGQTASTVYLGAKQLGYKVHLYDGSFEDWSGRDELPIYIEAKKDSVKK